MNTLYKLDCNNNVREWVCWNEDNILHIRYGLLNGKKVFERQVLPSPEDAEEQVRRRTEKQLNRKGYHKTIPKSRTLMPMLAHRYQKHADKLPEKVLIQPKLNGYRCLGSKTKMQSRTNTKLPAFPHIQHCLSLMSEDFILDGELYNHGSRFQSIMKSRTHLATEDSLMIEYHVFDCVEDLPYHQRRVIVSELMIELQDRYEKKPYIAYQRPVPFPILPVPTTLINVSEIETYHTKYEADGYEGIMIRNPDAHYEIDTRSYNLLKYKKREQEFYKIVDVIPGPRRKEHAVFVCELPNKRTFNCTPKADAYTKVLYLKTPALVLGKFAKVEFQGETDDGLPSHAVAIEVLR